MVVVVALLVQMAVLVGLVLQKVGMVVYMEAVAVAVAIEVPQVAVKTVQSVLFGLELHVHFHQLVQGICNESVYTN
jgi:hypothetical protein